MADRGYWSGGMVQAALCGPSMVEPLAFFRQWYVEEDSVVYFQVRSRV